MVSWLDRRQSLLHSVRGWLSGALGCVAVVTLVLAVTGCGSVSKSSSDGSSTTTTAANEANLPPRDGDDDIDSLGQGRYDTDTDADPTYGPAANAVERKAIVSLIERYYAAAAAGNGNRACSMLDPQIAETTVEEHHSSKGEPSLRGNTCSQILSRVFAKHHRELAADLPVLRVGWIQLQAKQAVMLVHFGPTREVIVRERRRGDGWRMNTLIDNGPV